MPKIPPRDEITSQPLYRATMAAQHLAYQLMRDAPADLKAAAACLHGLTVHATAHATGALDPFVPGRTEACRLLEAAAEDARLRVGALAPFAKDARDPEALLARLKEIAEKAEGLRRRLEPPGA